MGAKVKILFLTDNFPPEGNAPASRTFEHAREWVELGHEVTVITCAPNFPNGILFDGYKNSWYQVEYISGIRIVRVKTYITSNSAFGKRILDYISFGFMAFLVGLFQKRHDIIVSTSPQFFCACGAWLLSVFRRVPWVFELRDIWPASIVAVGAMQEGFAVRLLEKLELFLYKRADRIVSVTKCFKEDLISRGIDESKIDVVVNGVDLTKYVPAISKDEYLLDEYHLTDKFVIGYIGTHGMAHALDKVIEAACMLEKDSRIRFLFVGSGAEKHHLEGLAKSHGLTNVQFLPQMRKEDMPAYWGLCDLSLISLKNQNLFSQVIPSKIFESMGMGLPMLMSCPEGEATGIVNMFGAGVIVEPERPELLAKAITALVDDTSRLKKMSNNSVKAALTFDRKKLAVKMLHSFKMATD